MHRTAIAVASLLALGGINVRAQQKDVVLQRQALMKDNQEQVRALTVMARGQVPFNIAMVQAALQRIAQNARQIPSLFLANQESGPTAALPVLWERKDDFDARATRLEADAANALAHIPTQSSLQAVVDQIGQNCGGCHEIYRRKDR